MLSRGLNFCPTPGEPDMEQVRRDMVKFHRTLRIKTFFNPPDMSTGTQGAGNNQSTGTTALPINDGLEFNTQICKSKAVHKNNSVSGRPAGWLKKVRLEPFFFIFAKKSTFFKNGQYFPIKEK